MKYYMAWGWPIRKIEKNERDLFSTFFVFMRIILHSYIHYYQEKSHFIIKWVLLIFLFAQPAVWGAVRSEGFPSYFVWSYGISSQADVAPFQDLLDFMTITNPRAKHCVFHPPYTNIERGQLIWLHPSMLSVFVREILPTLQKPVFLLVNNSDHAFSSVLTLEECDSLMNHKHILHIFAQNCDFIGRHEKLTQIPIGLDYHTNIKRGQSVEVQEMQLWEAVKSSLPTDQRIPKIFVDFQHNDTSGQRKAIFDRIVRSRLVDYLPQRVPREILQKKKSQYAFSVSPHGNGLDCHRTWEDLILGCIVIVKTSTLDELYAGLPVVIVQDWDEICAENLAIWLDRYGDAFNDPKCREKLTNRYWVERIRNIMRDKLI